MGSAVPEAAEGAAAALERETSVPGLLRATCVELVTLLDARACAISRVIGEVLVSVAEYAPAGERLQLGQGYLVQDYPLTQEVIERGEPRLVSLFDDDPDAHEATLLSALGFASLLMVPLSVSGQCWGLVEIYGRDGRAFRDEDPRLAEWLAGRAGERIERLL